MVVIPKEQVGQVSPEAGLTNISLSKMLSCIFQKEVLAPAVLPEVF